MNEPLDETYLKWLYHQVASLRLKNPTRTYWYLLKQLYTKEYVWIVPNDDNRVEDGRDLRYEFGLECNLYLDHNWVHMGCSMLEMLIGLSRRLSFEDDGESREWFWKLIDNLDLREYTDAVYSRNKVSSEIVDDALDRVIWRTFEPDGRGGLFPLRNAIQDQREIEMWYQLGAYLLEQT